MNKIRKYTVLLDDASCDKLTDVLGSIMVNIISGDLRIDRKVEFGIARLLIQLEEQAHVNGVTKCKIGTPGCNYTNNLELYQERYAKELGVDSSLYNKS